MFTCWRPQVKQMICVQFKGTCWSMLSVYVEGVFLGRYTVKPSHALCVLITLLTNWCTCVNVVCSGVCASFSSLNETPTVSMFCRASIYLHSPDTPPAACQMSHMYVSYAKMCFSHSCVCKPKPIYLFSLRPACLRYRDTSVACGVADVGAIAARLFTLNHVGTLQTPCCCCSYGLVSSSYWLLAKLKAGERLIKDTWVCAGRQDSGCGFYWLAGLINTQSQRESLLAAMYCLDAFVM